MSASEEWYVRCSDGNVYGPAGMAILIEWAEEGRIEPSAYVSKDGAEWTLARLMPELGMSWVIEMEPGVLYGPCNRKMVSNLVSSGQLSKDVTFYRRHDLGIDEDPPPVVVEVEKKENFPVSVSHQSSVALRGMFANSDFAKLAALEEAARRELAAVANSKHKHSFFNGLFPRRKS